MRNGPKRINLIDRVDEAINTRDIGLDAGSDGRRDSLENIVDLERSAKEYGIEVERRTA